MFSVVVSYLQVYTGCDSKLELLCVDVIPVSVLVTTGFFRIFSTTCRLVNINHLLKCKPVCDWCPNWACSLARVGPQHH